MRIYALACAVALTASAHPLARSQSEITSSQINAAGNASSSGNATVSRQTNSTNAVGSGGAVSCEVAECSTSAVTLLEQGGSAADAIVAAALCVEVSNAFHSGIGGGGFGIVKFRQNDSSYGIEAIDFRESMPAAGNETLYSNNSNPKASTVGGLAVGVPGHLQGLALLHTRYGKLPWASLFEPAITRASQGFTVSYDLAKYLNATTYPFLLNDTLWSEVYAPNGTLAKEGDVIYRRRLASTLQFIALHGIGDFYNGTIAQTIVDAVQARGGIMVRDDLANYQAITRDALAIQYRNHTIYSIPAPASGAVVLSGLKIFEGFNTSDLSDRNVSLDRLIQSTRFAYGQRTQYGDPRFVPNVTELEALYLSDNVTMQLRSEIPPDVKPSSAYSPSLYSSLEEGGTSALVAVDNDGLTVSITTTVNLIWGSRCVSAVVRADLETEIMTSSGFVLNDEMDDFSSPGIINAFGFAPSSANFIRPGKRPLSSISNTITVDQDGQLVLSTGAAGGSQIITSNLQSVQLALDYDMSPLQVQETARWHDQLTNTTTVETAASLYSYSSAIPVTPFPNSTIAYLKSHAFNVTAATSRSLAQIIARSANGTLLAAADPRLLAAGATAF